MKQIQKDIASEYVDQVISTLLGNEPAIKATKYLAPNLIVRAVRRTYKFNGRKVSKVGNIQISLSIGRPNFVEREFISLCKKAKQTFPVRNVQLKFYKPKLKK